MYRGIHKYHSSFSCSKCNESTDMTVSAKPKPTRKMESDTTLDRVQHKLDNWKFWVGVAYFGLALVVLGLYILNHEQSNEAAKRQAIAQAASRAQLTTCVNAANNAPVIRGFISGQRAILNNQIIATTAALAVQGEENPLYIIRKSSLKRLETALDNNRKLSLLITKNTPTEVQCRHLAVKLHLPFQKHG